MADNKLLFEFDSGKATLAALRPLLKETQKGQVIFQKYEDTHGMAFNYIVEHESQGGESVIVAVWKDSARGLTFLPSDIMRLQLSTNKFLTIFLR